MTDRPLDWVWAETLANLRPQMTRATYDTIMAGSELSSPGNGSYRILAQTDMAKDWQENRLRDIITRALASIVGHPVQVAFGVIEANGAAAPIKPSPADAPAETPVLNPQNLTPHPQPLTPGQVVAGADYIRGYLEGDKVTKARPTGYSQVPHPVTYFLLPLLGPAFGLYKILEADDKRALKTIAPNYWTPPLRYSFQALAEKLNHKHHRYVSGDTYECDYSRQQRKKGQALACPKDCCRSPSYEWVWLKSHPKTGLQCLHWVVGQLEKLCEFGLARVELRPGEYKPIIHVWRMPPVITPYEYHQLTPQLQSDFDAWLNEYGYLFNIPDQDFWLAITEPHLAPHMPGYASEAVKHNWFEQYQKRRDFFAHALRNPGFGPDAEEST